MSTFVVLFGDQESATKALDQLYDAEYDDLVINVAEGRTDTIAAAEPHEVVVGAVAPNLQQGAVVASVPSLLSDFDLDEETAQFFANGMRSGGTVATIEVDDDDAAAVKAVLDRHGGQYTEV